MGEQELQRCWRKRGLGDRELPSPLNQCAQLPPARLMQTPTVPPHQRSGKSSPAHSISQFTISANSPANQGSLWNLTERRNSRSVLPVSWHNSGAMVESPPPYQGPILQHRCKDSQGCLFPWYWLVQQQVETIAGGIYFWIVDAAAGWLMSRSLIVGEIKRQVFPEDTARTKLPVTMPKNPIHSKPEVRVVLPEEPEFTPRHDKFQTLSEGRLLSGPLMTKMDGGDEEESQTLHWLIFTIEVLAVIPVLIIGLSLFYILAIGLYNDVNELLIRLFDGTSSKLTEQSAPLPSP